MTYNKTVQNLTTHYKTANDTAQLFKAFQQTLQHTTKPHTTSDKPCNFKKYYKTYDLRYNKTFFLQFNNTLQNCILHNITTHFNTLHTH